MSTHLCSHSCWNWDVPFLPPLAESTLELPDDDITSNGWLIPDYTQHSRPTKDGEVLIKERTAIHTLTHECRAVANAYSTYSHEYTHNCECWSTSKFFSQPFMWYKISISKTCLKSALTEIKWDWDWECIQTVSKHTTHSLLAQDQLLAKVNLRPAKGRVVPNI